MVLRRSPKVGAAEETVHKFEHSWGAIPVSRPRQFHTGKRPTALLSLSCINPRNRCTESDTGPKVALSIMSPLLLNALLARGAQADVNRVRQIYEPACAGWQCKRIAIGAFETGPNRPVSFLPGGIPPS